MKNIPAQPAAGPVFFASSAPRQCIRKPGSAFASPPSLPPPPDLFAMKKRFSTLRRVFCLKKNFQVIFSWFLFILHNEKRQSKIPALGFFIFCSEIAAFFAKFIYLAKSGLLFFPLTWFFSLEKLQERMYTEFTRSFEIRPKTAKEVNL